jgi:predicted kinase
MKEAVILVGRPGSGKTHYCRTVLPGHRRVSQDEGPRRFKPLLAQYRALLELGIERIVIDRTNPMRAQRAQFVELARAKGYRVRIVHFDVPRDVCEERIRRRAGHPTLDETRMAEAIDRYEGVLDPPSGDECDELVIVSR